MPPKNILKLSEKQLAKLNPYPKSKEELDKWIEKGIELGKLDYGKAVYGIALASIASFNYITSESGCTGFQAGCASLHVLAKNRSLEGPFQIVDVSKMLYPQYDLHGELAKYIEESKPWLKKLAKKKLKESGHAHAEVRNHWKELAK